MKSNYSFELFFLLFFVGNPFGENKFICFKGFILQIINGPLTSCHDFPHGVLTNHVSHLNINTIKNLNQHSRMSLKSCGKLWWEDSQRMSTHYFPILQAHVTCLELRPSTHRKRKTTVPNLDLFNPLDQGFPPLLRLLTQIFPFQPIQVVFQS